MSKHRNLAWKDKSKRNRHNGHTNAFKRRIISGGENFSSQGKNYSKRPLPPYGNITIVCADRRF